MWVLTGRGGGGDVKAPPAAAGTPAPPGAAARWGYGPGGPCPAAAGGREGPKIGAGEDEGGETSGVSGCRGWRRLRHPPP